LKSGKGDDFTAQHWQKEDAYEVIAFFIMPKDFSQDQLLAGRGWGETIKISARGRGRFLSSL